MTRPPRRRSGVTTWAPWVLAAAATACGGPFPPGWLYVSRVDRAAASVVWSGGMDGTATCRARDGARASAPATPGRRGLRIARLTGLQPGTRYACRVTDAAGRVLARVHFRTAPADGDTVRFAVVGDSGHAGPVAKTIARRIRAFHPDFLIHVGDLAYTYGTPAELNSLFFPPYRTTLRRVPLFPTPGNHDLYLRSGYRDLFAPIAGGRAGDGLRYGFRWGPASFVSLSAPDAAAGAPGVAADLMDDAAMPWRIVFLHEPLFTAGAKRVERGLRDAFGPIVERGRVDLVLAGHQHFYERSLPSCVFDPTARVLHVTSGGGSATDLDPVRAHPNFPRAVSAAHFLRVRATPTTLDIRAVGPEGRTIDRIRRRRDVDPGCRADGWPRQHQRRR